MNILVISDLHAYANLQAGRKKPSIICSSPAVDAPQLDILSMIPDTLANEGMDVDWILCPGDMADQAEPEAQRFAWEALKQIKDKTGARLLLATAGNHDLDSRLRHSKFDPKGFLQSLKPPFPGLSEEVSDQYWARNFHIYTEENIRLLNLNSAAFHGYQSEDPHPIHEYRHGRVSNRTIERIVEELAKKEFPLNILLTHHHPVKNEGVYADDYSEMALGGVLIEKICEATNSSWLVLHGHQHYPNLSYGAGRAYQPVVLSAGSVAAAVGSPDSSDVPNQFYLITLNEDKTMLANWGPCGTIRAWHWQMKRNWQRSPETFRIPYQTGFGCRRPSNELAQLVAACVLKSKGTLGWDEVISSVPELKYVLKDAFDGVIERLPSLGVKFTRTSILSESEFRKSN
jgi:3',5'-cyclic AMP phosphodiesterase CpdA